MLPFTLTFVSLNSSDTPAQPTRRFVLHFAAIGLRIPLSFGGYLQIKTFSKNCLSMTKRTELSCILQDILYKIKKSHSCKNRIVGILCDEGSIKMFPLGPTLL